MRADRLISILILLQNNVKMTTKELASKLEVSERTIIRDMDALSFSGIPVVAEMGEDGRLAVNESISFAIERPQVGGYEEIIYTSLSTNA